MNRIVELFNVKYPIIQAGMIWCSGWRLASAVSNAGGLGIIGSGSMYPDVLKQHVQKCKKATSNPFAVNLPLLYPDIDKHVQTIIDYKVPIVFTSAGSPKTWTNKLKENGFNIRYTHPNLLFISWKHWIPQYVRTEIKKKTHDFGDNVINKQIFP